MEDEKKEGGMEQTAEEEASDEVSLRELVIAQEAMDAQKTGAKEALDAILSRVTYKEYLPAMDKEAAAVLILTSVESETAGGDSIGFASQLHRGETSLGVIAYTNIRNDLGTAAMLPQVVDALYRSGVSPAVIGGASAADFGSFKDLLRESVDCKNIFSFAKTAESLSTEGVAELTKAIREVAGTDRKQLEDLLQLSARESPEFQTLEKLLKEVAVRQALPKEKGAEKPAEGAEAAPEGAPKTSE